MPSPATPTSRSACSPGDPFIATHGRMHRQLLQGAFSLYSAQTFPYDAGRFADCRNIGTASRYFLVTLNVKLNQPLLGLDVIPSELGVCFSSTCRARTDPLWQPSCTFERGLPCAVDGRRYWQVRIAFEPHSFGNADIEDFVRSENPLFGKIAGGFGRLYLAGADMSSNQTTIAVYSPDLDRAHMDAGAWVAATLVVFVVALSVIATLIDLFARSKVKQHAQIAKTPVAGHMVAPCSGPCPHALATAHRRLVFEYCTCRPRQTTPRLH